MSYKVKEKNIVSLQQYLKKKNGVAHNSDGKNKNKIYKQKC